MNIVILVALVLMALFSIGAVNLSDIGDVYKSPGESDNSISDEDNTSLPILNLQALTNTSSVVTTDSNCSNFLINTRFTIAQKAGLYLCKLERYTYNTLSKWTEDPFHFLFLIVLVLLIYGLILKFSVKGQSMIEHIFFLFLILAIVIIVIGGI